MAIERSSSSTSRSSSSTSSTRSADSSPIEARAREVAAPEKTTPAAKPVRDGMDDPAARREAAQAASRGVDTFSVDVKGPSLDAEADVSSKLATLDAEASVTASTTTVTTTAPVAGGTMTATISGPSATASASASLSPRAYEGTAGVSVETISASVSGETTSGIAYTGDIKGPSVSADLTAEAELGWEGVEAKVELEVNATLVDASGSISKSVSFEVAGEKYDVDVTLEANGRIAAEGKISLDIAIGADGTVKIEPSAEGFAGIEASLGATVTVSHEGDELASAEVDVTGRLGTGFTPGVDGDYELGPDGVLELSASAATPNVSVELKATVDTAAVGNAALETAESYIFGPSDENAAPPQGVEFDATYAFGA
jgi:hypothetical protein